MKKLLKILGVLAAVFVVLLVVAFFVIKSQFPPERLKEMAEKELSEILKREVSVAGAGVKLFPLGVKIEGLKIANNSGGGFSKEPFVDLPSAEVRIDLLKLLQLKVAIGKISIKNLSLLYEVMPDGRTSIDGLGGEPDTTKKDTSKLDLSKIELPGTLALKSFEIKNARVIYNDRAQKRKIILGSINSNVSLSLDRTLENIKAATKLSLKEVSLEDTGAEGRKGDIRAFLNTDINANLRVQHINIQNLSVGLQSAEVHASGTIDRFLEDIKVVNLKVETNQINLAELFKEIPASINPEIPKINASGTISLNTEIKGTIAPKRDLPLSGNLVLNNIAVSHSDLPASLSALTGNIIFTEHTVSVKPLTFSLAGQPTRILLDASDLLSKQPKLNEFSVDAKLDLGTLYGLANKLVAINDLSALTGRIEANISAKGILDPARPEGLSVNGSANMQNIVARTPHIPDAISLNGAVRFSNTEISAEPSLLIGRSDVRVKAVVRDYLAMVMPEIAQNRKTNINVNINSSNLELDRLFPPSDATKPPQEDTPPMEIYPELPDVIANVNVNLANTVFRHLTLSNFNLGINFANKRADVKGKGQLYTGSFNTNANVDLSNRKSADVKLALNVDKVEANDFITNGRKNISGQSGIAKQIHSLDNSVFGKLSMRMDVRTKGLPQNFVDNLNGPISVQITNGSLKGSNVLGSVASGLSNFEIAGRRVLSGSVPVNSRGDVGFENLKGDFEARNGQLLVREFGLNARSMGLLAFSGGVGFDGTLNLRLQNTLNSSMSSNLRNLTRASPIALYPTDASGNAMLFFNIGGTFTDPKVTLDAQKMSSSVSNVRDMATARLDAAKSELESKARAEADRLKAEAEAKAREAASKAKARAANEVKNRAQDVLKGFRR